MSAVWAFFVVKKEDTRLAICNSCKCEVMRGGSRTKNFNTSNLISHLKFRHTEIYKDYQTKVTAKQTLPTTNKPIQQTLDNTKKFDKDSAKAKAINCKVMEMIAIDDQPFSIVEDFGFRRLIEFIEPRYSLPSRWHFADVSLPALYNEVAAHIQMLLGKNVTDISFTTDIWSSDVSPVSMLSLTAQWIEDSFEMRRVMLHAQECPGSHTGTAIASALESMFAQWNITKDMVHVVLRDNGRNMVKAIEDCGLNSLGCMAHTLQLAVHEGVLSQRSISDCMAIGRKIVGHFKHSHLAMSRLGEIQTELGLSKKMLQQDTPTRWNSTFYMMSSLLVQKRALGAYGAEFELPASFSAYQWGLIENALTLLAPFEELTKEISSHTATASDVIPSVEALKRLLNKSLSTDSGVKTTKATLLEAVKQRFNGIYTEPLYFLATILDPRYKDRFFDQATKQQATEMLLRKLNKMMEPENSTENERNETEPPLKKTCTDSDGGATSLLDMYGEILEENMDKEHQTHKTSAIGQQVNLYPLISKKKKKKA